MSSTAGSIRYRTWREAASPEQLERYRAETRKKVRAWYWRNPARVLQLRDASEHRRRIAKRVLAKLAEPRGPK